MTADGQRSGTALRVAIVDSSGRPLRAPGLAPWLTRIAPREARGEVTVAVVSDSKVRALNAAYRGIDRTTDVLSFPTTPDSSAAVPGRTGGGGSRRSALRSPGAKADPANAPHTADGCDLHLGDIVIARGVAARQAREAGHSLATELRVLALHGLLHLLGHDHERDNGRMARLERRLRREGGLEAGLIERGRG
jgi:probable rRNA maturation factor